MLTTSIKVGQRVQYTEDGILSMIYGFVESWHFNNVNDRVEYRVKWDGDKSAEDRLYPRHRLHPVT
jgi:hypothetical protein